MARFVSEHTHNLILHGFTVRQAEMDVNRAGCFVDFLYKAGLALFDGGGLVFSVIHTLWLFNTFPLSG